MPKLEKYNNYYDYEQAWMDWKNDCDVALSGVRLPTVMGRSYYRPKLTVEVCTTLELHRCPQRIYQSFFRKSKKL